MIKTLTSRFSLFIFFSLLVSVASAADRITYDNQCLTIDGKDTYIFSGAFHYFRCPKELWHDRFVKMKLAGCNAVETYVAWNYHEKNMPMSLDDYSCMDMTDLHDFLKMATDDFGLYVILRPGPYICAEYDNGGFPRWLIEKKPADFTGAMWLRGDEPFYLAWCKHWYTAVAKTAKPFLLTNRPKGKAGIILWQLENEYDYQNDPPEVKRHQISALAHDSRDLGIDVPLFTCQTRGSHYSDDPYIHANVYDTVNSYPGFNMEGHRAGIDSLKKYQPDKLLAITEQQGGWFSQVGGKLSVDQGLTDKQITLITLTSMSQGLTSMNYYMFFGGTNLGDTAAHNITTTYDYNAPIREWGGVDKRYDAVRAIGLMLQEEGPKLCRAVTDHSSVLTTDDKDVNFWVRRATDGSRYIFMDTEQGNSPRKGTAKLQFENGDETVINYDLQPWDFKILYMPTDSPPIWLPKPAPPIDRPDASEIPGPVKITQAMRKDDGGPKSFKPLQPGQMLEDAGIYGSQFVFYRSTISKGEAPIPPDGLSLSLKMSAADAAIAKVGDEIIVKPGNQDEILHLDAKQLDSATVQPTILYENTGHENGGAGMETKRGISDWRVTNGSSSPHAIKDWRSKEVPALEDTSATGPDVDDSSWGKADISQNYGSLGENQTACYRASVDLGDADPKTHPMLLTCGMIDDDGIIYVNGQKVGESHDWSEPQTFDVSSALKPGKNVIAIVVHNGNGPGGLSRGVELEPKGEASPIKATWEISDQPQGVAEKWWSPKLNSSGWSPFNFDDTVVMQPTALLTWYRMNFELPDPKPGIWYPWKIKLEATGNGFIYLNDHQLGRYWQVGPQREYFLPECWLNFGKGKTNVVTLCLRPTTDGAMLKSAEVSPYAEWAEKR